MTLQGQIGPEGGVGVSFGVPFGGQSASETVGRRIAVREFVNRDEPGTQDLGRMARRYRIEAVLVGSDYLNQYNDLVDELERAGRKLLRHPVHGDRIVRVPSQELSLSLVSTGIARVTFDLIEAGPREPAIQDIANVQSLVSKARTARDLDARDRQSLQNPIGEFASALQSKLRAANSFLRKVKREINARLIVVDDLAFQIDQLDDNLLSLAATPQQIANAFGNLTKQVFDLVKTAATIARNDTRLAASMADPVVVAVESAETLAAFGAGDPSEPITTPERAAYAESLQAIVDMTRATGFIEAANVLSTLTFDSADQVRDMRSRVSLVQDAVLGSPTLSPDLFDALRALWGTLESYLSQQAQRLPRVVRRIVPTTMPVYLLAHEWYGDARRADDIVRRNRGVIVNPNFVPGGIEIEVLSV